MPISFRSDIILVCYRISEGRSSNPCSPPSLLPISSMVSIMNDWCLLRQGRVHHGSKQGPPADADGSGGKGGRWMVRGDCPQKLAAANLGGGGHMLPPYPLPMVSILTHERKRLGFNALLSLSRSKPMSQDSVLSTKTNKQTKSPTSWVRSTIKP